jgi:asparagine synthase (glutamine-hydrolysing)
MIVHAYEEWGEACVERFNGMFAFAIHDQPRARLVLARDRIGIKPLYYARLGDRLLFASEMKALLECPLVSREPDPAAIHRYLTVRYVPGPGSILRAVQKLPAAHLLTYEGGRVQLRRYWAPPAGEDGPRPDAYYHDVFAERFERAVRLRLMSDVPFGAFLSGGLDSSLVVSAMCRLGPRPVRTFSIGFGAPIDEIAQARRVAEALECDHHEVHCGAEDLARLPSIVWHMDEPMGDAIVLPMYLLAHDASRHVKVVLTGEGADEMLAGYLFHKVIKAAEIYRRVVPRPLRAGVVPRLVEATPTRVLNALFRYPAYLGERGKAKAVRFATMLDEPALGAWYRQLRSLFDPEDLAELYTPEMAERVRGTTWDEAAGASRPFVNRMLDLQHHDWLPDNVLLRLDKMTMASSIEGRVPFLDHTLVELLATAPPHLKLRGLTDKYLARRYGARVLPPGVAGRRKQAFYVPVEDYVAAKPFRELIDATLGEAQVTRRGYFRYASVRRLLDALGGREFVAAKQVLSLVILELWHMVFVDGDLAPRHADGGGCVVTAA